MEAQPNLPVEEVVGGSPSYIECSSIHMMVGHVCKVNESKKKKYQLVLFLYILCIHSGIQHHFVDH